MICLLNVVAGPATGTKRRLTHGQRLTIGRLSNSDFSIAADLHMSRKHLIIEGLADAFRVRDVGSSNGTFVNDFSVSVIELCDGDFIRAGTTVFQVTLEEGGSLPSSPEVEVADSNAFIPTRVLGVADWKDVQQNVPPQYRSNFERQDGERKERSR